MYSIYIPLFSLFLFLYTGCSIKNKKTLDINSDKYKINLIISKIVKNCQAKVLKDDEGSIFLANKNSYLQIDLNEKRNFNKNSTILNENSSEKLSCIIPIIKENSGTNIIITGHARSSKKSKINQHISDDRAISVAEEFFNLGIRDEIYAKGCSDKKDKENGQIEIFIYMDKTHIINHCR